MHRREFLTLAAGSPLIFGLRELLAQDPAPPAKTLPEWYRAALKRMKETNRYGIVIIVPDDLKERERWGQALVARYNEFTSIHHEPFGVAVLICMPSAVAEQVLDLDLKDPKALFKPNKVVLRPDGRVKSWFKLEVATLESAEFFSFNLKPSAYGFPKEDQLEAQAKAIEKTLPDAAKKAAESLSGETYSREAAAVLLEKADAILPWLVYKCHAAEAKSEGADPPVRVALRTLLTQYWSNQSMADADPCLPYGMKVEAGPAEDPCPPCGMAVASGGRARKFLSFFEK